MRISSLLKISLTKDFIKTRHVTLGKQNDTSFPLKVKFGENQKEELNSGTKIGTEIIFLLEGSPDK